MSEVGHSSGNNMNLELLSKKEAASFLKCSLATMNRFLLKQKISHYKIGGRVLFKKGDLVKFIEAHKIRCA